MATYAIYTYEIQEGNRSLFNKETKVKAIDMANEIVSNMLHDNITIVGKRRRQDHPLKIKDLTEHDGVFTWELCNVKDISQYEGHEKNTLESHPGGFIIVDNRPNINQICIEKNSAFDSDTNKVTKYLSRSLNSYLSDYGLRIVIKQKYQAGDFKKAIQKRIFEGDSVKKVVWEFPNPDKVKGIDVPKQTMTLMKEWIKFVKTTNATKGGMMVSGSKKDPINVDDEKINDWAHIIALSAQNNYKLSYYFFNSPVINIKDVASYAFCSIEDHVIDNFKKGQRANYGNGNTFELIDTLDRIRRQIADYDDEKTIKEDE